MRFLTPNEYRFLVELQELPDAVVDMPPYFSELTLESTRELGLVAVVPDLDVPEVSLWNINPRGELALRVHQAAIAQGVGR